jgi:two-component system chemotaxis response regulator CheY
MQTPKILFVDDSKAIRMLIAKVLRPYECTLLEASNGLQGLELAMVELPQLIILDVTMPEMTGLEALKRIRSFPPLARTPVIMLTAESKKDKVLEIINLGISAYIVKPFTEAQLLDKAGRVVALTPKSVVAG